MKDDNEEDISIIVEQSDEENMWRFTVVGEFPMNQEEAKKHLLDFIYEEDGMFEELDAADMINPH